MEPLLGLDPSSLGDYELLGRLGSGGFGVVYAATGSDGQKVAIKLLRPELSDDQTLRDRLAREGEALGRVGGQRNVKIHDVVTEGEFAYLVMDLVEGETLSDRVTENGPLTGPLLWFAAQGLVEALEDIHQAGIIHRDLKPSNVMHGPEGIKVLDFGISAVTDESALTQTGAFLATAAWISPEQVLGREVNEQSDVFNLGMVLAFAATGEHPFGAGRADAVMYRITNTEPELEGVPRPLREAVEMCLQRDPLERPSMETLKSFFASTGAYQLETGSQEEGTVIVQPDRLVSVAATTKSSEPLPTNDRKKKRLAPVVAVAAAAALVVGILAIQQPSNSETATTQENPSSLSENNVDLSTDQLSFEVEITTTTETPATTETVPTTTETPATTETVPTTTETPATTEPVPTTPPTLPPAQAPLLGDNSIFNCTPHENETGGVTNNVGDHETWDSVLFYLRCTVSPPFTPYDFDHVEIHALRLEVYLNETLHAERGLGDAAITGPYLLESNPEQFGFTISIPFFFSELLPTEGDTISWDLHGGVTRYGQNSYVLSGLSGNPGSYTVPSITPTTAPPSPTTTTTVLPVLGPPPTIAPNCSTISYTNAISNSPWIVGGNSFQVSIEADCPVDWVLFSYFNYDLEVPSEDPCAWQINPNLISGTTKLGIWQTNVQLLDGCPQTSFSVSVTATSLAGPDSDRIGSYLGGSQNFWIG
jgi:serine/threonine protein kinase